MKIDKNNMRSHNAGDDDDDDDDEQGKEEEGKKPSTNTNPVSIRLQKFARFYNFVYIFFG